MIEEHLKRIGMRKNTEGYAVAAPDEQIQRWRLINEWLRLEIPAEHFEQITRGNMPASDRIDDSKLTLIYSVGSSMDSLLWSVDALRKFSIGKFRAKQNPLWIPGGIESFSLREGVKEYPSGFHWLRRMYSDHRSGAQVLDFVQTQETYYLPSFEILQIPLIFPEVTLYINTTNGPAIGITGLKKVTENVRTTPTFSFGLKSCIGGLTANQAKSANELVRYKLIHIGENENLRTSFTRCMLLRDA